MQTPNNTAGRLTESMMVIFESYTLKLTTQEYNNTYSRVYRTIVTEIGDKK